MSNSSVSDSDSRKEIECGTDDPLTSGKTPEEEDNDNDGTEEDDDKEDERGADGKETSAGGQRPKSI